MIAQIDSIGGRSTYQLQIVLTATEPLIWRRVQVPGHANLGWLHAVLQVAMGWTNSHQHQFICGEHVYADPSAALGEFEEDPPVLDENKATVSKVLRNVGDGFVYEYDLGDSWEHVVMVDKILGTDRSSATTAVCLGGEGACPPEDCGGVEGYEQLRKILKNRKHPEHKSMKEWLGRPFDPEWFDASGTNKWLRKLKWPRVTEDQLRKVLMAREG